MIRSLNGIGNSSSSNITNNVYVNTLENGEAIEIEQVGTTTANKVNLAFKQNTTQASSVANNDLILIADNATGKVVKYVEANLVGQVLTATTPIEINNNVISTTFTKSSADHLLNKTITSFVGNSLSNINTPASSGTLATTSQFLTNPNFGTASTPIRTTTFGSNSQPTILNGSSIALGGKITNQIIIKGANASASVNSDIQFLENGNTICGNVGFTAGKLQLINNNSTDTLIGTYGSGNYKLEFVSDTKFKSSATNNLNDGNITNLTKINNHTAPPYAFNSGTIALQSDILNGKNFGTTPSSGITTFGADGATTQVKGTSITIETGTGTGNTLQLDGTIVNVDSTTFLNLKGSQITFEPKLGTGSVVFGAAANGSYYNIDVKDNIIKNTLTNANGSARPVHFGSDVELTNRTMNCGIVSASGNIFGANVVVDSVSLRDSGGGSGTSPLVLPNLMTDFAGGIISGNPTRRMGGTSSASEIKGSTIKLDSDVVNIGTTNSCVSTFKGSITTTGLINNKNLGTMDTAIATNASAIATINNAGYITASSADTLTNKSISYSQLTSTPTIPTNNTQLSNGAGYITASSTDTLTNKSLSYSQLTSTPTIPSNNTQLTNGAGYITASSSNVLSNKEFSDTPQFRDGEIMIKATSSSTIANPNVDCRVEFTDTDLATIAECGLTGNKFNLKNNIVNQNMDIGCAGTGIIKHLSNTEFKSSGVNNFNSGTITNLTSLNTHTIPSGSGELGLKANIDTNTTAIATNASNISNNASSITSNTSNIATNASNISTNTTNILTNTGNITANTGNISENAGNITSNTANISTLLNAGYITASSTDTLTNKSLSYSQLTGTPTIPNTTTASNFGTSSSSNVIVGSTTKHLELQGTSIDIEDKDGTSIIEITDSDTKFKGTDISIIGRSATISPKMYFTNFTNPFTSYIRLVGQADAGASGTHTLTLPQATGTLALLSDIPSAGNGIFTTSGSFPNSKVATATLCNEYIFSSGVNANGSCRIVLKSDTNNVGADTKNTEILFKKENDLVQGSIGMGRPGTETNDNDMIIDCKTFTNSVLLQTQGTTRLEVGTTEIVASKIIRAPQGISINKSGECLTIKGTGAGNASACNISFRDSNDARIGAIGDGSPSDGDFYVIADTGDINMLCGPNGAGVAISGDANNGGSIYLKEGTGGSNSVRLKGLTSYSANRVQSIQDNDGEVALTQINAFDKSGGALSSGTALLTAPQTNDYIFSSGVNTNLSCRLIVRANTDNGSGLGRSPQIRFEAKNATAVGFIGLGFYGTSYYPDDLNIVGASRVNIFHGPSSTLMAHTKSDGFEIPSAHTFTAGGTGLANNINLGAYLSGYNNGLGRSIYGSIWTRFSNLYFNVSAYAGGSVNGGSYAGYINSLGFQDVSDRKFKTNIIYLDSSACLQQTLDLKPCSYRIVSDPERERGIGFIAQEVIPVVPEVVSEDGTGSYGLGYGHLTATLSGAVQELNKKIVAQQETINSQEERLKHLENIITKLTSSASFANFKKII